MTVTRFQNLQAIARNSLVQAHDPRTFARWRVDQTVNDLMRKVNEEREEVVKSTLFDYFEIRATQDMKVNVRRPGWMPRRLYNWLWRQIIVTETPLQVHTRGPQ